MDHGDEAYIHANNCLFELEFFNLTDEQKEILEDERQLSIFEAKGVKSAQEPDDWFEFYLTENDRWKRKNNFEKATLLSASKESIESILESLWKFAYYTKDKLGGIRFIGKD